MTNYVLLVGQATRSNMDGENVSRMREESLLICIDNLIGNMVGLFNDVIGIWLGMSFFDQ